MIQYLLDEHIHPAIALGLWQLAPALHIVQVHLSLPGQSDTELLAWAAEHGYILVTADRNTLINDAYKRMEEGLETEGVCYPPRREFC
jgi:predicted nuclease of predicted toxin-antitoxin system